MTILFIKNSYWMVWILVWTFQPVIFNFLIWVSLSLFKFCPIQYYHNTDKKSDCILGAESVHVLTGNSQILVPSWQPWKCIRAWSPKITCCYCSKVIKSDPISNTGYKTKAQKYVVKMSTIYLPEENCAKSKSYVLLLTCHPCNIYASTTCSRGCIVVSVYCRETNPHQAVLNPHSSFPQHTESLQMLCKCPLLEHHHSASTFQIQLLDTAHSALTTECQTLCLFYIKYWMGSVIEWKNKRKW